MAMMENGLSNKLTSQSQGNIMRRQGILKE